MSTPRTALAGAGLAATVLAAAAPTAAALGVTGPGAPLARPGVHFSVSVSPSSVQPGGAVDLTVDGCTDFEAFAESAVFDRIGLGMAGEIQSARTTVDADARVGAQYEVAFSCGDETATAVLTIVSPTTPTSTPTATTTATATATATATSTVTPAATVTTAKPTLGAQAGVGGSQTGGSGGPTMLLAGAGITALALAGGVLAVRRRPRGRA
ncbi:LPXTG cell wall anchor domain-containing protein [Streptomyces sp. 6N223]|uniref:LPXTG cell wall anchor domain-containing protein n=1 Tax=Streptomyces sp. 6N223 TaxID=3457412 RepID=UPI003FD5DC04